MNNVDYRRNDFQVDMQHQVILRAKIRITDANDIRVIEKQTTDDPPENIIRYVAQAMEV